LFFFFFVREFKRTTMLDHQKKLTKDDIKPILPKFYKENDTWKVLFPGDDGYEDHQ
jgi:hypothetical protein